MRGGNVRDSGWPVEKLTALRLGRPLVAEVPASGPGRRAFVTIQPVSTPTDAEAAGQGWSRSDLHRAFQLHHWDYDAARLDGFDYDIDAVQVRATTVTGEDELTSTLAAWGLQPEQFRYPWQTADPR